MAHQSSRRPFTQGCAATRWRSHCGVLFLSGPKTRLPYFAILIAILLTAIWLPIRTKSSRLWVQRQKLKPCPKPELEFYLRESSSSGPGLEFVPSKLTSGWQIPVPSISDPQLLHRQFPVQRMPGSKYFVGVPGLSHPCGHHRFRRRLAHGNILTNECPAIPGIINPRLYGRPVRAHMA